MLIAAIEPTLNTAPWRFQFHPEIWILVIGLVAAFVYAVRVVGPKVAPAGQVISRKQILTFCLMIVMLWSHSQFSFDWIPFSMVVLLLLYLQNVSALP